MSNKKGGMWKFLAGLGIGAGLGVLFAPKSGEETRKELKKKMDEFVVALKDVDIKPMIFKYDICDSDDFILLKLNLAAGNSVNLNPILLLKAAGKYIEGLNIDIYYIERNNLISVDGTRF